MWNPLLKSGAQIRCLNSHHMTKIANFGYNPPRCWKSTVVIPESDLNCVSPSSAAQAGFGKIYDKKPFKFSCIQGQEYLWCACGQSHSQPLCDRLCLNKHFKISMRAVKFIAPESKDYWFCNCKQTSKRPFCDGTHRREDVVAAVRV